MKTETDLALEALDAAYKALRKADAAHCQAKFEAAEMHKRHQAALDHLHQLVASRDEAESRLEATKERLRRAIAPPTLDTSDEIARALGLPQRTDRAALATSLESTRATELSDEQTYTPPADPFDRALATYTANRNTDSERTHDE